MIEQLNWFKSSYSGQPSTDCVEAAFLAAMRVKGAGPVYLVLELPS
ncbi:DUF397 domain-containing protein [Streptomyces aureus]